MAAVPAFDNLQYVPDVAIPLEKNGGDRKTAVTDR